MGERWRASIGLFLLAMAVLLLEVALTRVFSVMLWHHFVYLIVSLALLGFGAASTFLTVRSRFGVGEVDPTIVARYAWGFSLSTVLGFAAATKIRFLPMDIFRGDLSNLFSMLMLYSVIGFPFFFAGVCIGLLITRAGEAVNRLYFADLLGAGTGALLSIAMINTLGGEGSIYAAGGLGAWVAQMYAKAGQRPWLRLGSWMSFMICLLLILVSLNGQVFPIPFQPEKEIAHRAAEPHYFEWHVVGRIDVMNPFPRLPYFGGALSSTCDRRHQEVPTRAVFQDGTAPTGIVHVPDGDVKKLPALEYYLQGAPYVIKRSPQSALVIGVGGGIDVLIALHSGAQHVVGVEVNPICVKAVRERYADFAGRVFNRPDVELVVAEGRHYVTSTQRQFDVIQLSGVDSFAALSSGAYALSESYLYTVEAMRDYWKVLREDGLLSFSRLIYAPPRESLRLVSVLIEALRQMGISNPERHLIVISGAVEAPGWAETLLKKNAFSHEEIRSYHQWADRMRFEMLYDPEKVRDNPFDRLIRSSALEREKMIAEYPYQIGPITDDDPFFFQFSRFSSLVSLPKRAQGDDWGFPLGLAVLLLTLVQVLLLASVFILGPLLSRLPKLRAIPCKGRVFVYFAALGLGFVMLEIALMQKYTVFVGGPVYAMAVTLSAVLVFSGVGSLLAGQVTPRLRRPLVLILLVLAAAVMGEILFVNRALPRLMFLSHASRCLVTMLAVSPLALLMGMPFPTGLRAARRLGHAVLPWVWGINAVATTIGAILCVLVSMFFGFTATLCFAASVYLVALLTGMDDLPLNERIPVE